MQLVFWLGKKQIRYQDLNHRNISAAASSVVSLRGSDYFIFPPAVSPETITDLSAGKIGKQEGKANNKLIKISLPCHPSIPLRFEPLPVGENKALPSFPSCFRSHSQYLQTPSRQLIASTISRPPWQPVHSVGLAHLHMIQGGTNSTFPAIRLLWACNKLNAAFGSVYASRSHFSLDTHTHHSLRVKNRPHTHTHGTTSTPTQGPPPPWCSNHPTC